MGGAQIEGTGLRGWGQWPKNRRGVLVTIRHRGHCRLMAVQAGTLTNMTHGANATIGRASR